MHQSVVPPTVLDGRVPQDLLSSEDVVFDDMNSLKTREQGRSRQRARGPTRAIGGRGWIRSLNLAVIQEHNDALLETTNEIQRMPKNADSVHQMETHSGFLPAVSDDVHFVELRDGAEEQMRQQVLSYS